MYSERKALNNFDITDWRHTHRHTHTKEMDPVGSLLDPPAKEDRSAGGSESGCAHVHLVRFGRSCSVGLEPTALTQHQAPGARDMRRTPASTKADETRGTLALRGRPENQTRRMDHQPARGEQTSASADRTRQTLSLPLVRGGQRDCL